MTGQRYYRAYFRNTVREIARMDEPVPGRGTGSVISGHPSFFRCACDSFARSFARWHGGKSARTSRALKSESVRRIDAY